MALWSELFKPDLVFEKSLIFFYLLLTQFCTNEAEQKLEKSPSRKYNQKVFVQITWNEQIPKIWLQLKSHKSQHNCKQKIIIRYRSFNTTHPLSLLQSQYNVLQWNKNPMWKNPLFKQLRTTALPYTTIKFINKRVWLLWAVTLHLKPTWYYWHQLALEPTCALYMRKWQSNGPPVK